MISTKRANIYIMIGANYFLLLCRCKTISLLDCIINSTDYLATCTFLVCNTITEGFFHEFYQEEETIDLIHALPPFHNYYSKLLMVTHETIVV